MNHTSTPVSRVRKGGLPPLRRRDANSIVNKLMNGRNAVALLLTSCLLVCCPSPAFAQTQTTGRITGTVKDQNGALIVGAEVKVVSDATGEERRVSTNEDGAYSVPLLSSGRYRVSFSSSGFSNITLPASVTITETNKLDVTLIVAGPSVADNFVTVVAPLVQSDGPQLGRVVDARTVSELPLAARNFTQLLTAPASRRTIFRSTVLTLTASVAAGRASPTRRPRPSLSSKCKPHSTTRRSDGPAAATFRSSPGAAQIIFTARCMNTSATMRSMPTILF